MKFNKLIPELVVADINKSLNFYVDLLGFKKEYERQESKFSFISFEGSQLMIQEVNNSWNTGKLEYPFGRGVNFQIEVKDLNNLLKKINSKKYSLFTKPEEHWYRKNNKMIGCKEFLIMDPDGYLLRFSQTIGEKPFKHK